MKLLVLDTDEYIIKKDFKKLLPFTKKSFVLQFGDIIREAQLLVEVTFYILFEDEEWETLNRYITPLAGGMERDRGHGHIDASSRIFITSLIRMIHEPSCLFPIPKDLRTDQTYADVDEWSEVIMCN